MSNWHENMDEDAFPFGDAPHPCIISSDSSVTAFRRWVTPICCQRGEIQRRGRTFAVTFSAGEFDNSSQLIHPFSYAILRDRDGQALRALHRAHEFATASYSHRALSSHA